MPPRRALPWLVAPPALVLLPGAVERMGASFEDEALRLPLSLYAVAAALLAATPSPRAAGARAAGAAALLLGLPVLLHPFAPQAFVGTPLLFLLVLGGVGLGAWRGADPAARRGLEAGLGLAGVLAAAWTLSDALAGRPAVGPVGRAGVTGPLLAALLPFTARLGAPFAALVGGRDLGAVAAPLRAVPALVVVGGLVATGSRTGLLAAGLGALLAFALAAEGRARRRRLLAGAGFAGLATVGLVLGVSGAVPGLVGRTDTLVVRQGLARASAALIAERPLAGHGAHGFPAEVLRVRDLEEARISEGRRPLAAHDDVLHFAVEGGVLAGLAALALLGLAVVAGVRSGSAAAAGAALAIAVASLAEDPLLASPTALLAGWIAGLPRAGRNAAGAGGGPWARRALVALLVAAGCVCLCGLVTATDASPGVPPQDLRDETTRAQAYRRASRLARGGALKEAEAAYWRLLELDPGMTEARLDLAEIARLSGAREGARGILEEARRRDPTRFDVPLRLGHLALGDEPAPSEPAAPKDPVLVLRLYDEAIALAPRRFEGRVALSRVHRRMGRLDDARRELAEAKALGGLAPETVVESFRIAEAEGSPAPAAAAILALACGASPAVAAEIVREAERFLDVADEAEREALVRARQTLTPDLEPARKDRGAASLRLAAMLAAGSISPEALAAKARAEAKDGRRGRAVARWRALLADPERGNDADLAFEAAKAASGVDPDLAAQWQSRGRTLLGFQALKAGDFAAALRDLRAAVDKDPGNAAAKYGLARAFVHAGDPNSALRSLTEAVTLDPSLRGPASSEPDLADVFPRLPPK